MLSPRTNWYIQAWYYVSFACMAQCSAILMSSPWRKYEARPNRVQVLWAAELFHLDKHFANQEWKVSPAGCPFSIPIHWARAACTVYSVQ